MAKPYAELHLCDVLCPNWTMATGVRGISEGDFPDSSEPYVLQRWQRAMDVVEHYLRQEERYFAVLGYERLVESLKEADMLIEYAVKNIPESFESRKLHHCCHGQILFSRLIRMGGKTKEEQDNIIWLFKKSAYTPKWKAQHVLFSTREYEMLKRDDPQTLDSLLKQMNLSHDQPWIDALTFFS